MSMNVCMVMSVCVHAQLFFFLDQDLFINKQHMKPFFSWHFLPSIFPTRTRSRTTQPDKETESIRWICSELQRNVHMCIFESFKDGFKKKKNTVCVDHMSVACTILLSTKEVDIQFKTTTTHLTQFEVDTFYVLFYGKLYILSDAQLFVNVESVWDLFWFCLLFEYTTKC